MSSEDWNKFGADFLPGLLGIEVLSMEKDHATARLEIRKALYAPNGYLHAGSVVTLADTIAGYACFSNLPEGATSFTTIELKANFTGTLKEGKILAHANLKHGGKMTQLWDVVITDEATKKEIALFRCTQMILYPKS